MDGFNDFLRKCQTHLAESGRELKHLNEGLRKSQTRLNALKARSDAWDPAFDDLRQSIASNYLALVRGERIQELHRSACFNERLFWDRFREASRNGRFAFFERRWNCKYLLDPTARYLRHFEEGRFDSLIREWATV